MNVGDATRVLNSAGNLNKTGLPAERGVLKPMIRHSRFHHSAFEHLKMKSTKGKKHLGRNMSHMGS
jgi:hypothetical protein